MFYNLGSNNNGFTLLQVLIAIVILGVALIPISRLFTGGIKNISKSEVMLEATIFASTLMDTVRNHKFLLRNKGKRIIKVPGPYKQFNVPQHFLKKYKGKAEIHILPSRDFKDLCEIKIRVSWIERKRKFETWLYTLMSNINDSVITNNTKF